MARIDNEMRKKTNATQGKGKDIIECTYLPKLTMNDIVQTKQTPHGWQEAETMEMNSN